MPYEVLESTGAAFVIDPDRRIVVTLRSDDVFPCKEDTPWANADFCASVLNGTAGAFPEPSKSCTPGPWRLVPNEGGEFDIEASSPEGVETVGYVADGAVGARICEVMQRIPDWYWEEADEPAPRVPGR